jgi:hypothetical protein
MAAFRKRNNKWQAQIRIKGQAPRTKSFITKRDAESWARKVEAELEASAVRIDPRALERSTVCDLLERYRKEVTVAKRGAASENTRLDGFLRQALANKPRSRVTPQVLDLSRFDAAPLIAFTATKEMNYETDPNGRIP